LREQWAIWLENQTRIVSAEFKQCQSTFNFFNKFQRLKKDLLKETKANIAAILSKKLIPEQNFYHILKLHQLSYLNMRILTENFLQAVMKLGREPMQ
jgi:hypothetical protein